MSRVPTSSTRSCLVALAAALVLTVPAAAQSPSVLSLLPTQDQALTIGSEVSGTLSSSDYLSLSDGYLDAWALSAPVGSSVTVDLQSVDFDAMLFVVGPGLGETLSDDDGGGGCNSRLTFRMLEEGPYRVVATSLGSRATGTYAISVSERPEPAPGHSCGEPSVEMLTSLDTEGRTLSMGSIADGAFDFLTPSPEGRPVQAWSLAATAGERMAIVLESDAFDALLYLVGPGVDGALSDDDGAGELNSLIEFTPTSAGPYTVVASALDEGAVGGYTLIVRAPVDLATLPAGGQLDVGQTVQGFLTTGDPVITEGRHGMVWALEGTAGQRVTIELLSEEFDAFLYVAGPGLTEPITDDDGAGDLNSRISLTFPESGTYRVIASALETDVQGSYTLRVSPM